VGVLRTFAEPSKKRSYPSSITTTRQESILHVKILVNFLSRVTADGLRMLVFQPQSGLPAQIAGPEKSVLACSYKTIVCRADRWGLPVALVVTQNECRGDVTAAALIPPRCIDDAASQWWFESRTRPRRSDRLDVNPK
jgi:hypothetical protein